MTVCTHLQVWRMQKKEKDPRPGNNNTPTMIRRARPVAVTIPVLRVAGPQLTLCQHTQRQRFSEAPASLKIEWVPFPFRAHPMTM